MACNHCKSLKWERRINSGLLAFLKRHPSANFLDPSAPRLYKRLFLDSSLQTSHSGSSVHMTSRTKSLMSDFAVGLSRSVMKVRDEFNLQSDWIKAAIVIYSCTGAFFRGESSPNGSETLPPSTDIPQYHHQLPNSDIYLSPKLPSVSRGTILDSPRQNDQPTFSTAWTTCTG